MRRHAKASSAGSTTCQATGLWLIGIACAAFLACLLLASSANAAGIRLLKESFGSASQPTFTKPFSVAVDKSTSPSPSAGDVLVFEGGTNEVQSLQISSTSGKFKLCFQSACTPDPGFEWNSLPNTVQTALRALPTINGSNVTVTGTAATLSSPGSYTITFVANLGSRDVPQLTATDGTPALAGGTGASIATTSASISAGIKRFRPDGTPHNFAGLGTNFIDGQRGPGGKTKAECESAPEPASCDETPLNGFSVPASAANGPGEIQIAIDNSGTATDGDIYVTQTANKLVYIFSKEGKYLGQLTAAGATAFGEICGASVASNGELLLGQFSPRVVRRFALSPGSPHNPLLNADWVGDSTAFPIGICNVAAGAGSGPTSTVGATFAARNTAQLAYKLSAGGAIVYTFGTGRLVAVNPATGTVFVSGANSVSTEYDASGEGSATEAAKLTAASTIQGLAVSSDGERVYLSRAGSSTLDVFGAVVFVPTVAAFSATEVSTTKATLNGSVNPEGDAVSVCRFEYMTQAAYQANGNSFSGLNTPQTKTCAEAIPVDKTAHPVSAALNNLKANTTYRFRLFAENGAGPATSTERTFATSPTVVTGQATGVGDTTATLNGSVNPVGEALTECKFEYGTTTSYGSTVACNPSAASIDADFQAHSVSAALSSLAKSTTYHFRLVAKSASGPAVAGADMTFTALGAPKVSEEIPLSVGKTTATLRAKLNPNGSATTYHFEWGTNTSYGKRVPVDSESFAGAGTDPVTITAHLSGLPSSTEHHFRIVATNASGETVGGDRQFETLNEHSLPDGRAAELVSIPDKRPVGTVEQLAFGQVYFQATESGDQMGYLVLNGVGDTPAGGELIYGASRSAGGWSSTAISAPSLIPSPTPGGTINATPGRVRYLDAENLKCGVVETHNPLSADTPKADVEQGVSNLYRWNAADHSYTLLTNRIPLNPAAGGIDDYQALGASRDCSRVFFYARNYSFFEGASGLYEWDDGVLRDAGLWPDSGGGDPDVLVPTVGDQIKRAKNTVAENGHFFFQATSVEGDDTGTRAVFVRKGPDDVLDASQPTHGPTLGARYEGASADGRRVFFLANYHIAASSSTGPTESCVTEDVVIRNTACDLYSYDVETEELTDVSASTNPADTKGAVAQGVMAISEDGSVVYFAARGQLVPGEGRTYAQNLQGSGFANVYRYDFDAAPGESLGYVGSITAQDVQNQAMMHGGNAWNSQTNDSGSYFLYGSRDNMTGTNPAQVELAYVYSHDNGINECISCPRDGSQPHARYPTTEAGAPRAIGAGPTPESVGSATTTGTALSEDGRVVFNSEDVLAPGGIEGEGKLVGALIVKFPTQTNVYEWHRGQVSLLATGTVLELGMGGPDGRDVFIKTFEQMVGQDFDFNADVYDLRAGGGFAPPPPPPIPCDPAADQCQGTPGSPPAASNPASANFTGPGNEAKKEGAKPKPCPKGKVRKGGKCVAKGKPGKKAHKRSHKRAAKANRGGVK